MEFVKAFKAARRVSVPLLAVRSADPASTTRTIAAAVQPPNGPDKIPVMIWDVVHGMRGFNQMGKQLVSTLLAAANKSPEETANPIEMLTMMYKQVPATRIDERYGGPILLMYNAHLYWKEPTVTQAIWNLRDVIKEKAVMLVMLTTDGAILPQELVQDVMVLDEPLPTEKELETVVKQVYNDFGASEPKSEILAKAIDAIAGLTAFQGEQSTATCLTREGLNTDELWERKRQMIEQTPGLSIWRGGETFSDIQGYDVAKQWGRRVLEAKKRIRGVVFMDEIEKMFAGTGTDLSGVKTEMTGSFLSWMQDRQVRGALLLGPPGSGKSLFGKSIGNEGHVPTIALDFGAMQSSLVGSSGERLRSALKRIDAVTQGSALVIGTCNSLRSMPPELRRRFGLGTFFFDLPTEEERELIWNSYLSKMGIKDRKKPDDVGWTGAEIFECCRKADDFGITLKESAAYIVPVAVSAADQIRELRRYASGRFLSASAPGPYRYEEDKAETPRGARAILDALDGVAKGSTQVGNA